MSASPRLAAKLLRMPLTAPHPHPPHLLRHPHSPAQLPSLDRGRRQPPHPEPFQPGSGPAPAPGPVASTAAGPLAAAGRGPWGQWRPPAAVRAAGHASAGPRTQVLAGLPAAAAGGAAGIPEGRAARLAAARGRGLASDGVARRRGGPGACAYPSPVPRPLLCVAAVAAHRGLPRRAARNGEPATARAAARSAATDNGRAVAAVSGDQHGRCSAAAAGAGGAGRGRKRCARRFRARALRARRLRPLASGRTI
jgi:hypothetical protein